MIILFDSRGKRRETLHPNRSYSQVKKERSKVIVIYETFFYLDVAQGRMNKVPSEVRTQS